MPTFNVHLIQTVSTTVTVEADDPEEAIELAYNSDDMPGSMTYGAFGRASVDEAGDWEPQAVTDESGNEVWTSAEAVENTVELEKKALWLRAEAVSGE